MGGRIRGIRASRLAPSRSLAPLRSAISRAGCARPRAVPAGMPAFAGALGPPLSPALRSVLQGQNAEMFALTFRQGIARASSRGRPPSELPAGAGSVDPRKAKASSLRREGDINFKR